MINNIAIIPARGGSKRLPNKNLLHLGDIPLVVHSIRYALQNNSIIDEVYVSTDSEEIKKVALENGAKVIDRPQHLSGDFEPTASALKHCLEQLPASISNVFLLQPTNPLRPAELLKDAYKAFTESKSPSLMTVSRNNQKLGKIIDGVFQPFNYKPGQRSQDLEPLYFENGLLYISSAELVLNETIISNDVTPFITDHIFANVDIDTQDDLEYARLLMQHNF
ncbi:MAG TPA: acylneuraminate cytidylyltransferase family protein [Flavobacterium sp.]|jgi:N-acylneuraminate cytidylyltransferase